MKIFPRHGSELGGNIIHVQGPCFSRNDTIRVQFGDQDAACVYVSSYRVACVVPPLPNPHTLSVKLVVNGVMKGQVLYTTCKLFDSHWQ